MENNENKNRQSVSDYVNNMLQEEIVFICPLGLSKNCERFENIEKPFTNHHINGDSSKSVYWNLIKICEPCHEHIHSLDNKAAIQKKIRLRKKNLALQYFSPIAINVLRLAYQYNSTSAMPSMAMKLLENKYVTIANRNTFSVGMSKHFGIQDYAITQDGKELIEKLIGKTSLPLDTFAR